MAPTKVRDDALRQFMDAGHTQAQAARHFGVSEAAVHQRLKRLGRLTAHVIALEQAGEVVEEQRTASARLERIQRVIDGELAAAVEQARRPGADRAALRDAIIRLAAEVRQQLHLQLGISRTLIDLQEMRDFQRTVVEAIREEAPTTAQRIVDRLKQRRALRASAQLPSLDGADPHAVA
jgi:hypothetical protein